ncbi:ComF family protein [Gallaecimonas pentaromativorans]|uniref:ComF family protein n=1 Tax=Gallaecimonas pentaromativorans TaxID=584787 RepID=UPI003A918AF3
MTSAFARILARLGAQAKPEGLCWLCLEPSALPLCSCCLADLHRPQSRCRRCAEPGPALCRQCARQPPPFDEVHAGVPYGPPFSHLIHRFKYQRQWWLDAPLCQPLLATLTAVDLPDCLVPVPMHWSRRLWRGFNQSALLANYLGKALGVPVAAGLVQSNRATAHQQGLGKRARRQNLKGAFSLTGPVPRHLALVDDVMTTGTTVAALAQLLKAAGCERVQVWCLARA